MSVRRKARRRRWQLPAAPSGPENRTDQQTVLVVVTLHHFTCDPDLRGELTVGEFERQISIHDPKRYFIVTACPILKSVESMPISSLSLISNNNTVFLR